MRKIDPSCQSSHETIQVHLLHFWRPVYLKWEAKIPISQHLIDHLN